MRLNASTVLTDVQQFTDAVAQGNLEQAVEIAQEPFLEGFYLRESLEFEQWMDRVRWEFEGRVYAALESLVKLADERGDAELPVVGLSELRGAIRSMRPRQSGALAAYEATGDYAHARHFGEWLERTLREEYDAPPGTALKAAIDRVRTGLRVGATPLTHVPAIAVLPLRNISPSPKMNF